ncbi:hypothetical protein QQ045_017152 [Rhodiola kirilowii]
MDEVECVWFDAHEMDFFAGLSFTTLLILMLVLPRRWRIKQLNLLLSIHSKRQMTHLLDLKDFCLPILQSQQGGNCPPIYHCLLLVGSLEIPLPCRPWMPLLLLVGLQCNNYDMWHKQDSPRLMVQFKKGDDFFGESPQDKDGNAEDEEERK